MQNFHHTILYIEGSMLINSFILGKAGISCLEMPEQAMNLNTPP
jgi:hypothetical protein